MTSAGGQKPVRKFPPPCWTRDEALVLIEAYRERWYALHRAFLRTSDWDAVAEKVTTSCPDVTPPKTSAQCRHKMEKLRQRHRAEKQRASAFPGERFFSTWIYYEAMEVMENGSNSEPATHGLNPGPGIRVKPLAVDNFTSLPPNSTKQRTKPNHNPNPNFGSNFSNRYSPYHNHSPNQEDGYENRSLVEAPIEETLIPHKRSSIGGGIRIKPSFTPHEESGRPGLRPRKFSKVVRDDEDDDDGGMWMKGPRSRNSVRNGKNLKKNGGGVADVVRSIKLLGEGFMKVEKMKMDMAREIERMRMETEMKRNELMLESQKQIVDAFVEGLMEYRKIADV
ncbi:hypothetical protein L1987_25890 [Smallanthus sonchifolius]|uniref:Uncharacterized protein n=1 Tax=Smallanthus sonchifolius TaxID=185202 RepID=A0ACB9IA68_9ASTR|nr:hypothetical protein L1987_25890 [Smallanthus sonchifolius]